MVEELEKLSPATVEQAEEHVVKLLRPKEKRKVNPRLSESDEPENFVQELRRFLKADMPDMSSEAQDELAHLPWVVPSKRQPNLFDMDASRVEVLVRSLERLKTAEQLHQDMSKPKGNVDGSVQVRQVARSPRR